MYRVVELKLVVCDDFTGTVVLVSEDAILESDDGIGVADGLALGRNGLCYVVWSDFKSARVILIAATGVLS